MAKSKKSEQSSKDAHKTSTSTPAPSKKAAPAAAKQADSNSRPSAATKPSPARKTPATAKAAPAKAAAAKPAPGKSAKPARPAAPGLHLVDTNLAAQAAAKMLLARAAGAGPPSGPPAGPSSNSPANQPRESSTFKNLKESLAKPHLNAVDNLLDKTAAPGQKRPNLPYGQRGNQQVGHNQTFGADLTRSGVPRRTGG